MYRDFYATAAQVLPVLMLAFVWESRYLERLSGQRRLLRRDDPNGVRFWTKPRVRAYTLFTATTMAVGTAVAVLVLSGVLTDHVATRVLVTLCVMLALMTLLFRITVDVLTSTREDRGHDNDS